MINIRNNIAYLNKFDPMLADYYYYVVEIFVNNYNKLSICCDYQDFKRVEINWEHFLVWNNLTGAYILRICRLEELLKAYMVIDYSPINVYHLKSTGLYPELQKKHYCIHPCFFGNNNISKEGRTINTLTTFYNPDIPRRRELIKRLPIEHKNVQTCYGEYLQELYSITKILINIGQTDYHHTFESLRCLPALQEGCIIISEKNTSELIREQLPYNNMIIWCELKDIHKCVENVIKNYDAVWDEIFIKNNSLDKLNVNNMLY